MIPRQSFPRLLAAMLAGFGMTLMIGCSQPTPASGPAGDDPGGGAVEEGGGGSSGGAAQPTYTDGVDPSRSSSGDEVYPPPATEVPVPEGYPDPEQPSDGAEDEAADDGAADEGQDQGEGEGEGDSEEDSGDEG